MFKINIMMKNNKHFKKKIVLLIIVILYFLSLTVILGKYAVKGVQNVLANSQEFYFYSDTLKEGGVDYTVSWDGTSTLTIPIKLYTKDKENNFAKAKDNINYELSYIRNDGIECNFDQTSGTIKPTDNNMASRNLYLTYNSTNSIVGKTITITAKSTGTFEKELSATYTFQKNQAQANGVRVEDRANRGYCTLIVNNTDDDSKTYKVSFPTGILIDSTNAIVKGATGKDTDGDNYIDEIEFSVAANSSENIKFYKTYKARVYEVTDGELKDNVLTYQIIEQ